jgi:CDP-paratose 2-epimerase
MARPALLIGGAGFIGSNLADRLLQDGEDVIVFDNLSRPGVERNLSWLESRHAGHLHVATGDVRDADAVATVVADARAVFDFAAQVAVTSSLEDPLEDFAVNAQGTLTVLEAVRRYSPATPLIFASTNKVYGGLADIRMELHDDRYAPADPHLRAHGIAETRPLDFCTPYGCSKGAADQYVLDYAHSFGLRTAVLRMSCIYGPRQFGTEDQGWVAHFLIRALRGQPITIFGDGRQVRDILHVSDAVAAYRSVLAHIDSVSGRAFNLGGGPANSVSLRMVLEEIEALTGFDVPVTHQDWRTGDQFYFVADTARLQEAVGWHALVGWLDGLRDLAEWVQADLGLTVAVPRRQKRLRA